MVQNVNAAALDLQLSRTQVQTQTNSPQTGTTTRRVDSVSFSASVSVRESQDIVVNRAFEQLRSVVAEARAELGIPEGEEVDTSPEATANRIADFALNFFDNYAENNGLEDNEEGRSQFAEFIGDAINKGIEEARGILTSLNALNPEVESGVDQISDYIQGRLDDFVTNGLG